MMEICSARYSNVYSIVDEREKDGTEIILCTTPLSTCPRQRFVPPRSTANTISMIVNSFSDDMICPQLHNKAFREKQLCCNICQGLP